MVQPVRTRPSFPQVSLSHQGVSINLLALFIRGQRELKQKSQKTDQTNNTDHSLV